MLPFFTARSGNAASRSHDYGWDAEEAVERARAEVAAAVAADHAKRRVLEACRALAAAAQGAVCDLFELVRAEAGRGRHG